MPFVKLLSRIPWPVMVAVSDFLYLVVYRIFRYRVAVVNRNLSGSFPEKSDTEIRKIRNSFYRSFFDFLMESVKGISISEREISQRVVYSNPEFIDSLPKDKPVVLLGSHMFNWEWVGMVHSIHTPRQMYFSYQKLSNKFSNKLMNDTRSKFGAIGVLRNETARAVIGLRKTKDLIMLIADQSPVGRSRRYWTKFLNQETCFYQSIGDVCKMANASVIIVLSRKTGRGTYEAWYELVAGDVSQMEGEDIVERYIAILERQIQSDPSSWLWTHRRWKHQRREDDFISERLRNGKA